MDHLKIVVIIPAINEEHSIAKVIAAIPQKQNLTIIVADNGSQDRTPELAAAEGADVVFEKRRGYGWACLAGMHAAKKYTPDVVVFLDGDFSDYPEEMDALIAPIVNDECDMVIGSRTLGQKTKGALLPQAIFGNWLATQLIYFFWRRRYTDLGPFRAIRWKALLQMDMRDKTFGWTVEMQIKAAQLNMKTVEIPVSYRKRIGVSKVTGTVIGTIKASYKILFLIFYYGLFVGRRLQKRT